MKKTIIPVIAGVLMILAAIPFCAASTRWFFESGYLPETMGGGEIWPWMGLIMLFPFALPLLAGGICAFVRRAWVLAFIGTLSPLIFTVLLSPWGWARIGPEFIVRSQGKDVRSAFTAAVYIFIVAAAVMLYLSRKEFKGRKSATEHLFGPPPKYRDTLE